MRKVRKLRRIRRAGKAGKFSVISLSVLAVLAGLAVLVIMDQTLRAPEWVRDRVESRLEANLGGLQIEFGDVEMVISQGWRPRAALRDVRVSDADGRPIVSLSDVTAALAMRPLLEGQIQPKFIALSGAFITLRRDAEGVLSLAFDGGDAQYGEETGLAALLEQMEAVFKQPQMAALTQVTADQLNLRYEDAVSGQAWTLDGGALRLTREQDMLRVGGNLTLLGGRDFASSIELNYASEIGDAAASVGLILTDVPARDIASQAVALSWLEPLRAPLSGALRASILGDGSFGPLNATLQIGTGVLQPTDQTRPIPFDAARAYFTYLPDEQVLEFDEISVSSPWVTGTAEGSTFLDGIEDGLLTGLIGQLRLTETQLNPAGAYPEPIAINQTLADFKLELDPFTLTVGELVILDQGSELRLEGDLSASETGWLVAVDGDMDALTPERLVALWPPAAIPKTRSWIERNLTGGTLTDVNVALRVGAGGRPDIYLDFDYDNAQVQFMRTMPPITGAKGHASLVGNRFVTTATEGEVIAEEGGAVNVAGTSFIIPDTSIRRAAPSVVRLQGRGSITSVLSLLNRPPLKALEGPGLPVTVADGTAVFQGNLAVPLKNRVTFDEVSFFVEGLARNVASSLLVPGQFAQAPTLAISATESGIEIAGDGLISDVPFSASWRQVFGQPGAGSRLDGTIALSQLTLDAFNIGIPPGVVTGTGVGEITLDLTQDAPPELALTSDLTGLALNIPELGWTKAPQQSGALTMKATLSQPAVLPELQLSAPGLAISGSVRGSPDGGMEVAEVSRLRRGDWLDVQARFEGRGPNSGPAIRVLGGELDLRRATFESGNRGTLPPPGRDALVVQLDRLQITDTIALSGFQGDFALRGGLAGEFRGAVNGGTAVTGVVVPDGARSAVRVKSDDAGGVFRDARLLRQAYGGEFDMTLRPVGEPGTFEGILSVAETSVRDAPAIAAILNAISIVGLLTEISGQGIFFNEVAARFQLSPSQVTLYESRATGPSMGLSMDGIYDVPNAQMDMRGVITPVYLLNQIGGLFAPRRGEGLFGFNYTLTGSAQDPQVGVNPLSGLTPGVLRDIFRSQPPPAASSSGRAPAPPEPELPTAPTGGDR